MESADAARIDARVKHNESSRWDRMKFARRHPPIPRRESRQRVTAHVFWKGGGTKPSSRAIEALLDRDTRCLCCGRQNRCDHHALVRRARGLRGAKHDRNDPSPSRLKYSKCDSRIRRCPRTCIHRRLLYAVTTCCTRQVLLGTQAGQWRHPRLSRGTRRVRGGIFVVARRARGWQVVFISVSPPLVP